MRKTRVAQLHKGRTRAPSALGVAVAATILAAASASPAATSAQPDLSGVWLNTAATSILKSIDAAAPPLNPAGLAAYNAARADIKSGKTVDIVHKYCLPEGVPRLMSAAFPFKIVQSEKQLTTIHESHHTFRIVLISDKHPPEDEAIPGFMGDAIGRWEGGVLVIDTVFFNTATPLDASGLPHSEKLHTVERLSRSSDGRTLVDLITIEDPVFYLRPWTVKATYRLRNDLVIEEYTCGEPHRNLSKVTKP